MSASRKSPKPVSTVLNASSLGFAEDFVEPSDLLRTARENTIVLGGSALSNGACTALTFLARTLDARAVVTVGSDAGVAGLALFAGMNPEGILTTIGTEADWQLDAREAFTKQGIASNRFRLIVGNPLDVTPKLLDDAYDLIFIDGDKLEYVECVEQSLRLLRPGGIMVINDALWHDLIADSDNEDDETLIIREALTAVLEIEQFTPLLLPLGDGLLVAVKNSNF